MYRRDSMSSPMTPTPVAAGGTPVNNAPPQTNLHNYAPRTGSLKNKFQNVTLQENHGYFAATYYGPGGKQEYFGKHELEYQHHQQLQQQQQQQQKLLSQHQIGHFPNQKHDFPPSHHAIKSDFNHKTGAHHEFHSKSGAAHHPHEFHHQNQMYYNHEGSLNQYPGQYYHNEYDQPEGYYDPKSSSHYYDSMNYHQDNYYGENMDNFGFTSSQQYYESQQAALPNATALVHGATQNHHHLQNPSFNANPATTANSNNNNVQMNYAAGTTPNSNLIGLENSNSSSDFNFLSNLANDFAPEYYQLS